MKRELDLKRERMMKRVGKEGREREEESEFKRKEMWKGKE